MAVVQGRCYPVYLNGITSVGLGVEAVAETRQDLFEKIDEFFDKGCTVITLMKGPPGAPVYRCSHLPKGAKYGHGMEFTIPGAFAVEKVEKTENNVEVIV